MFSTNYLKKVYNCYDAEIHTATFYESNMTTLLKTLILYREKDPAIESYEMDGQPLRYIRCHSGVVARQKNAIVTITNDSPTKTSDWFDKAWYSELISTFMNNQLGVKEEDENKYGVYIDTEQHTLYLELPSESSEATAQLLVCGLISKLLPWFFKDVSMDNIKEITTTLGNHENENFNMLFEKTLKEAGITQKIMEKDLRAMGDTLKRSEIQAAEQRVRDYQRRVDDFFNNMCRANNELRVAKNQLAAVKMADDRDGGVAEIIEFLQSTPQNITIDHIEGSVIGLLINTTFQTFDEWSIYTNMDSCYLYKEDEEGIEYNDKNVRAYTELFSNPEFKIHTSVGINLDLMTGKVETFYPSYGEHEAEHPHLNTDYNCFGSAATPIAEYIKDFRYTEALNQIVYAARQFTVSDGAAGNKLLRSMRDRKCIELPTGEFVNMAGLLRYLGETEEEEA